MLKRHISTLIIAAAVALTAAAQSATQPADSMSVQQKRLTERRAELRKLITEADAQRNKTREGVAAVTNEALNDRQDSICLDLRSQLTDVELQLKELGGKRKARLLQQAVSVAQGRTQGRKSNNSYSK